MRAWRDERDRPAGRQGCRAGDHVAQGAALDQLHREEDEVAVLALVVHRDHTGVGQPCRRTCLPAEPRDEVRSRPAVGEMGVHDLERDLALEAAVQRPVDGRHPAAGELGADLVTPVDHVVDHGIGTAAHPPTLRSEAHRAWDLQDGVRGWS